MFFAGNSVTKECKHNYMFLNFPRRSEEVKAVGTTSRREILLKLSHTINCGAAWESVTSDCLQNVLKLSLTTNSSFWNCYALILSTFFLSFPVSAGYELSYLCGKTQLLPPPALLVMISHVTLNILLPSRRVFLSSELKRPSILKIQIFKNLSVLFFPNIFLLIIWEYHTIHPITLDSHSSQVHPPTLAPSPQNRQKEKLKKKNHQI